MDTRAAFRRIAGMLHDKRQYKKLYRIQTNTSAPIFRSIKHHLVWLRRHKYVCCSPPRGVNKTKNINNICKSIKTSYNHYEKERNLIHFELAEHKFCPLNRVYHEKF